MKIRLFKIFTLGLIVAFLSACGGEGSSGSSGIDDGSNSIVGTWVSYEIYNPCENNWDASNTGDKLIFGSDNQYSRHRCNEAMLDPANSAWECTADIVLTDQNIKWEQQDRQIKLIYPGGGVEYEDYEINGNYLTINGSSLWFCIDDSQLEGKMRFRKE